MALIPRMIHHVLVDHLAAHRQIAFVSGPRQVGKTTTARGVARSVQYLNWDDQDDRRILTRGPAAIVDRLGLDRLGGEPTIVVLDELHKYRRWRTLLKGLFDRHADRLEIIVTGSSRMDLYRRGGDSLMGRYLPYRMHPLTVGELVEPRPGQHAVREPRRLAPKKWDALWEFGGFPEPFAKRDRRFARRWRRLRGQQLVREDVRDLSRISELAQLEVLVALLDERSGSTISYAGLARDVNVSVDTARRWVATLCQLHHGFLVRPWFRSVKKSLRKEPKWFLRDWSGIADPGRRAETLVACHLLKAVQTWDDLGLGSHELHYLRDKAKREVDLLVVRDGSPWLMVEVKHGDTTPSRALRHFQNQIGAPHALQAVIDLPFVDADCFARKDPCVVPARTLLSQLP
jgi:predicted AAA+ superfamily ATPase